MQRVEDFETEEEIIYNRLRIRKYLRELMLNQKRLIKAATDAALKEKQIKIGEELKKQGIADPAEIPLKLEKDVSIFLEALDKRLGRSKSPFFENSDQPKKSLDLKIYEQLKEHHFSQFLTPDDFPNLYSWNHLMSLFSSSVTETWMDWHIQNSNQFNHSIIIKNFWIQIWKLSNVSRICGKYV